MKQSGFGRELGLEALDAYSDVKNVFLSTEGVTAVGDFVIRPYEPADRARVRHICFVTGYMGDPVEWQWRDAESFSNIFTGYYTDAEPESALVAEIDGEVTGYLLGCVDSSQGLEPGSRRRPPAHPTRHRLPSRHGRRSSGGRSAT